jgi:O-antigen ligase
MVVFAPWAFGTTQRWSIWTLSLAGYVLGLLFALKLLIRRVQHYCPARWDEDGRKNSLAHRGTRFLTEPRLTAALGALTVLILGYCLVSAVNARATFQDRSLAFEYRNCIQWLPHSLDASGTWFAFWSYLGLASSFWAVRDWLLGKSDGEQRAQWQRGVSARSSAGAGRAAEAGRERRVDGPGASAPLPARLRRLLWLLALNGALLGLEGIVQRAAASPKLVFLVKPRIHQTAESQFGPYAYRSNAAQYFNLLWPLCLGFWWTLNRASAPKRKTHHLLLVCAAIMAACPIISTSRGGALVAVGMAALAAFFLVAAHFLLSATRREGLKHRNLTVVALSLFFTVALGLGLALGWKTLKPRLADLNDGLEGREELYVAAGPMAADYPWFGTGPGTFETVSQLYPRPDTYWPPQLHNDWLETRITFGRIGSALLALAFVVVLLRWFTSGGIHGGRRFVLLTWLALAGCLVHARFDFPFQIHSILFLVVVIGAMLFGVSRRP